MKRTSRISSALTAMLLLAASLTACGETAKTPPRQLNFSIRRVRSPERAQPMAAPQQILPL